MNRPATEKQYGLAEWTTMKSGAQSMDTVPLEMLGKPLELIEASGGRVRHTGGTMNGLEKRYAAHLEYRKAVGEVREYRFEAMKLRLAASTFIDIDFLVWMEDRSIELHEVKGRWEDDARVKIKWAGKDFPWFKVIAVQWDKNRKEWKFEEFAA